MRAGPLRDLQDLRADVDGVAMHGPGRSAAGRAFIA
jgi:hypothetical protein